MNCLRFVCFEKISGMFPVVYIGPFYLIEVDKSFRYHVKFGYKIWRVFSNLNEIQKCEEKVKKSQEIRNEKSSSSIFDKTI